jgi:hypothetical protein
LDEGAILSFLFCDRNYILIEPMLTIYAILIYFQQIFTTTTYTQVQMDQIVQSNQQQIQTAQQDEYLMNHIHQEYDDDAVRVSISDPAEGY